MPGWSGVVTVTDAPRYPSQTIGAGDVANGRFVRTVTLDGGTLTVTPAPSSLKPGMWSARDVASVLWATWQLRGYTAQVLGFGLVTLTRHEPGVPSVTRLPSWVEFAAAPLTVASCFNMPVDTKFPHGRDGALRDVGEGQRREGERPYLRSLGSGRRHQRLNAAGHDLAPGKWTFHWLHGQR